LGEGQSKHAAAARLTEALIGTFDEENPLTGSHKTAAEANGQASHDMVTPWQLNSAKSLKRPGARRLDFRTG